jgi:hypothetical protein
MKNFSLITKKNSHRNSDSPSVALIVLLTFIAIGVIFILRGVIGIVMVGVVEKVEGVKNYFANSGATLPVYIRDRKELRDEILQLEAQLAIESGNHATIGRLTFENEELRRHLGDTGEERILGGVIARPPFVPYDLLVIDRGEKHGIIEGALVYHETDHVVGTISKVYEESSLVTLFSTAGVETTVYLYGPNVFAYAYGEGGGVIRISVPQGIEVPVGSPVVLPSIHTGDIGVVEHVMSSPAQPEQNAYVTFPVPIQSIRTVTVGKTVVDKKTYNDITESLPFIHDRFKVEVPDSARSGQGTTTVATTSVSTQTETP